MFKRVAQENTDFLSFSAVFFRLAVICPIDDETLNILFWIGANFNNPINLIDTLD